MSESESDNESNTEAVAEVEAELEDEVMKDSPSIWIEISAVIVSLCALFLTVYQTIETQNHNELSVKPHLVFEQNNDGIILKNNGLGPAVFKFLKIEYGKDEYDYNVDGVSNLLVAVDPNCQRLPSKKLSPSCGIYGSTLINVGRAISVGESVRVIYCKGKDVSDKETQQKSNYENCKEQHHLNPNEKQPQIKMTVTFEDFYSNSFTKESIK